MTRFKLESQMLDPLIRFLVRARRVNSETIHSAEFPWFGRRIDLATMTKTRRTTAYELKLSDNFRAVQQAARNNLAFDRSYVVTATMPSDGVLEFALEVGVGIIYLAPHSVRVCLNPSRIGPEDESLRKRLLARLKCQADQVISNV